MGKSSSIHKNASLSKTNLNIPTLEEISNRFYDFNINLHVKIDYSGYIKEINGIAPFVGLVSVKNIINILNRDINVVFNNDEDLIKIRNTIIFYNEYLKNDENYTNWRPANIAYDRIEHKYIHILGIVELSSKNTNPFKQNVLDGLFEESGFAADSYDDAMEEYIKRQKKESGIKSSKFTNKAKPKEEIVPMYVTFSKNMPNFVDMNNLEYCFEDCDFID